jgi:beta-glucuronidase
VAVDQRLTLSLNGEWHYILDPYLNGGGSGRSGYPMDEELPAGSNKLLEYSFAKSPTIKVPGDWNTQRVSLLNYEGGFWYERHFQYQPQAGHRTFLHIGAANYRSRVWVNGQLLCAHEGGYTPFDCEATKAVKAGSNSVVIFVDSTRIADGVPTLKTDWYNYAGELYRRLRAASGPGDAERDRGVCACGGRAGGDTGYGRSAGGEAACGGRDGCRRAGRHQHGGGGADPVVSGDSEALPRGAEGGSRHADGRDGLPND